MPQFVLLPKRSELPKILGGGGCASHPRPPKPVHLWESCIRAQYIHASLYMYYNDLILANGAIRLSFFLFCFEGQRGKGCLIHLLYTSSTHSPNSMLLSDLWKHKRAQKEPPCTDWLLRIPLFCNFSLGELSLYFILLKSIIIIISLISVLV